jgi:SAM-dependent methyltransferase
MRKYQNVDHKNSWQDTDVENHWDNVADIYIAENEKVKNTHNQRFTESIKYLELTGKSTVLNISSRDCEANDYIKNSFPTISVINAEISQGLIDVAKKVRPYAQQIKIGTYSKLPFENARFDRIICLETLEHVSEPIKFLKELHRISTINARLVLSCPPQTSEIPYRIYTALFGGHGEGPHRFLPSSEVKAMFEKTGWKLTFHKGTLLIPAGPFFLQNLCEFIIQKLQNTFISELGIRQFYVCEKYS